MTGFATLSEAWAPAPREVVLGQGGEPTLPPAGLHGFACSLAQRWATLLSTHTESPEAVALRDAGLVLESPYTSTSGECWFLLSLWGDGAAEKAYSQSPQAHASGADGVSLLENPTADPEGLAEAFFFHLRQRGSLVQVFRCDPSHLRPSGLRGVNPQPVLSTLQVVWEYDWRRALEATLPPSRQSFWARLILGAISPQEKAEAARYLGLTNEGSFVNHEYEGWLMANLHFAMCSDIARRGGP